MPPKLELSTNATSISYSQYNRVTGADTDGDRFDCTGTISTTYPSGLTSWVPITSISFECGSEPKKEEKKEEKKKDDTYIPKRIIYNDPATVVFWKDGTKTVVKKAEGEKWNKYIAFCAALAKKIYGNNSRVNKIVATGVDQSKKEDIKKKGTGKNERNGKSKKH